MTDDVKPEEGAPKVDDAGEEVVTTDEPESKSADTDSEELKKAVQESMKRKAQIKDLQADLDKAAAEAEKTRKALKEMEARFDGIDPKQVRELLKQAKEAERSELESKGEYQRIIAQVNEEHESAMKKAAEQFEERQAELKAKMDQLQNVNQGLTVGRSFSDSEFVRDELTLTPSKARQVYGAHFEVDENGNVIAYDKPAGASDRTMIVDGKGAPAPFEDAIKKILSSDPEHDQLIRSKMKPGANSKTEPTDSPAEKPALKGVDRIGVGLAKLGTIGS